MRKVLTAVLKYDEDIAAATAETWTSPTGDMLWTPQQDIIVVGINIKTAVINYYSDLAGAGTDTCDIVAEVTQASSYEKAGAILQCHSAVSTTLQGAITNSGPTFPSTNVVAMAMPADCGILVPEGADLGMFVRVMNETGNACTFQATAIIHYVLRARQTI